MASGEHELINELYSALDQNPSSIDAHELLLEAWDQLGDKDAALGIAQNLIALDPNNEAARPYLRAEAKKASTAGPSRQAPPEHTRMTKNKWSTEEKQISEGYKSLTLEAGMLRGEIEGINRLGGHWKEHEQVMTNLQAIVDRQLSTLFPMPQPLSVRETARTIMKTPQNCQDMAVADFEAVVSWCSDMSPPLDKDAIRKKLINRKTLLEAALPETMQGTLTAALAQIERGHLEKKYVNSETMISGDPVSSIPEQNFFVSEDNYAWDMEELVQAIISGEGVMRNPLSREMFSLSDIRMILDHPLGESLKPLQIAQDKLKRGTRPATIEKIGRLGQVLLNDQSEDFAPGRKAMDEFQAYAATLPQSEQEIISSLKIPVRDRNTKQPYDYSVGESLRDGIANATCLHKVGDFLTQAAVYLGSQ